MWFDFYYRTIPYATRTKSEKGTTTTKAMANVSQGASVTAAPVASSGEATNGSDEDSTNDASGSDGSGEDSANDGSGSDGSGNGGSNGCVDDANMTSLRKLRAQLR